MKNLPFDNMVDMDASRNMTTQFLGYNHTLRPGQGQWYDMKNLTSSFYPVLSPRRPRGLRMNIEHLQGIAGKDKLAYVADNQLYFGDQMICDLAAERYEILVSKPVDWDDDCTKYFADTNGTRATHGYGICYQTILSKPIFRCTADHCFDGGLFGGFSR